MLFLKILKWKLSKTYAKWEREYNDAWPYQDYKDEFQETPREKVQKMFKEFRNHYFKWLAIIYQEPKILSLLSDKEVERETAGEGDGGCGKKDCEEKEPHFHYIQFKTKKIKKAQSKKARKRTR